MIKSRKEILAINPCFASCLVGIQKANYAPSPYKKGDDVILDDSLDSVILSQEQAESMNAEEERFYLVNRDEFESEVSYDYSGNALLISSQKNIHDYLQDLGQAINGLTHRLGPVLILGDWNTPWLYQKNEYPPAKAAYEYLSQQVEPNFNGGFVLASDDLIDFIPHLFWLTRCNMALPTIWMAYESSTTIMNICKNGILHFEFYDKVETTETLTHYKARGFKSVETCSDPIEIDKFDGRQIIV